MLCIRKMGLALLASFSLFACQRDAVGDKDAALVRSEDGKLTFTATIDEGQTTRTSLSNSKVVWNTNEKINIFYGSTGSLFTSTNDSPSTSVSFEGYLSAFTGSTEGGEPLSFWSVYPYHPDNSCSETAVSAFLPDEQFGIRDNIPDNTMMMVAKTPGLSLSFKQVCATLRVVINRSDITKVVIRGNQGEVLAGRVSISMDDSGAPEWAAIENEGSTEITLRIPEDNSSSSRYYYLCLLPQSFASGISVTYYTPTLKGEYVSPSRTFERNQTYAIGSSQVTTWVDRPAPDRIQTSISSWDAELGNTCDVTLTVSGPDGYIFDPDKFFLWGTGDDEIAGLRFPTEPFSWRQVGDTWQLTLHMTASSIALDQLLRFCYGCTGEDMLDAYFDEGAFQPDLLTAYAELSYSILPHGEEVVFDDPVTEAICLANYDRNRDGVLTVNEAAAVTTLLVNGISPFNRSDDLPPQITSFMELRYFTGLTEIPYRAFFRQISLKSIILPDQITAIGSLAFALCANLGQITIPASVRVIEDHVFFNCPLASVTFDEGSNLNTIGDQAFAYVFRASSIAIPESVTSFGNGVFKDASVSHVRLPSSMTVIPQNTFYKAKVNEIEHDRWDQITEIGENAFYCEPGNSRIIPRALPTGLRTIGNSAFQNAVFPDGFTLPSGVTQIGDNAFKNTNLSEVDLNSVTILGYGAFSDCPLEKVYIRRNTLNLRVLGAGVLNETFGAMPEGFVIYVPYDWQESFRTRTNWETWSAYIFNNPSEVPGNGNLDDGDFGDGGDA